MEGFLAAMMRAGADGWADRSVPTLIPITPGDCPATYYEVYLPITTFTENVTVTSGVSTVYVSSYASTITTTITVDEPESSTSITSVVPTETTSSYIFSSSLTDASSSGGEISTSETSSFGDETPSSSSTTSEVVSTPAMSSSEDNSPTTTSSGDGVLPSSTSSTEVATTSVTETSTTAEEVSTSSISSSDELSSTTTSSSEDTPSPTTSASEEVSSTSTSITVDNTPSSSSEDPASTTASTTEAESTPSTTSSSSEPGSTTTSFTDEVQTSVTSTTETPESSTTSSITDEVTTLPTSTTEAEVSTTSTTTTTSTDEEASSTSATSSIEEQTSSIASASSDETETTTSFTSAEPETTSSTTTTSTTSAAPVNPARYVVLNSADYPSAIPQGDPSPVVRSAFQLNGTWDYQPFSSRQILVSRQAPNKPNIYNQEYLFDFSDTSQIRMYSRAYHLILRTDGTFNAFFTGSVNYQVHGLWIGPPTSPRLRNGRPGRKGTTANRLGARQQSAITDCDIKAFCRDSVILQPPPAGFPASNSTPTTQATACSYIQTSVNEILGSGLGYGGSTDGGFANFNPTTAQDDFTASGENFFRNQICNRGLNILREHFCPIFEDLTCVVVQAT